VVGEVVARSAGDRSLRDQIEHALEERYAVCVDRQRDAGGARHLAGVTDQPVTGDIGRRVHAVLEHRARGAVVEPRHLHDRRRERIVVDEISLARGGEDTRPDGF
jgi:hypothetical protein